MPVSRIESICVVADLYDLKTPNGNEKVIVAVPFNVKLYCMFKDILFYFWELLI